MAPLIAHYEPLARSGLPSWQQRCSQEQNCSLSSGLWFSLHSTLLVRYVPGAIIANRDESMMNQAATSRPMPSIGLRWGSPPVRMFRLPLEETLRSKVSGLLPPDQVIDRSETNLRAGASTESRNPKPFPARLRLGRAGVRGGSRLARRLGLRRWTANYHITSRR
jgi:hypothetical protein